MSKIITFTGIRILCYLFLTGIFLVALFSFLPVGPYQVSPYRQVRIPLNMQTGVPFIRDVKNDQYIIHGFEIDSNENFYFLAGKTATLACFSGNGKNLYRKSFSTLAPGEMEVVGRDIYFLEVGPASLMTLVEIDKNNGTLLKQYPKTIGNALKSHGSLLLDGYDFDEFNDSVLHVTYIDTGGNERPKTICFNLKAELIPNCTSYFPDSPPIDRESQYEKLGKWGKEYVLGKFDDDDENKYDLTLRDSANNELASAFVDRRYLGQPMCGEYCMPKEHRKVRNGKLYMLNREKNVVVISEIDLATIFHRN